MEFHFILCVRENNCFDFEKCVLASSRRGDREWTS